MEDEKIISTQETPTKEVNNSVDYEEIDKRIINKVETEVGKFIKTFIENNANNMPKVEKTDTPVETEEERELKQWKI